MSRENALHAIMFADVAGSSRLYKQLGDEKAKEVIGNAVASMAALSQAAGGSLIKTIGDEVMVSFSRAEHCVTAAINIQQYFSTTPLPVELRIRIGASFGTVIEDQGDFFGEAVNDAAAVANIAKGRQIIVSDRLFKALPRELAEAGQLYDQLALKGGKQKSQLFRISWEQDQPAYAATQVMSHIDINAMLGEQLHLSVANQHFVLQANDTPFLIGRNPETVNLLVNDSVASREHCEIQFNRGKFVLVDHSTNGTYVRTPDDNEIYLRREELPLTGEGKISIGKTIKDNTQQLISYICTSQ